MKRLKVEEKQKVTYAIANWLRDEQIKDNIKNVAGRIEPHYSPREEPAAVVGYGPSLQDTWEQVRDFEYIFSCSGSHKYLIERGIIPTWHVEVDPRSHKIQLLGEPHPDVTYLVSSTCSPKYVKHLQDHNAKVLLWHVFDNAEDGIRTLPAGEWALTGGCDVGFRSITIAAFLGFRDLHIFGMDGCARETRHAAEHPYTLQGHYDEVEYPEGSGKIYLTTPGMLAAAQSLHHELDALPTVKFHFYGEGLIQALHKDYQPDPMPIDPDQPMAVLRDGVPTRVSKKGMAQVVGYMKPETISTEYKDLNAQLHRDNLAYGVGGGKFAPVVLQLLAKVDGLKSVLDYGCGKGYLGKELSKHNIPIWEYDPAIPGKDESPRPADLVVCTDVLEHIEPDKIVAVLQDLKRVTKQIGYFVIHTGPSAKTLADGRNAHILQRDKAWWEKMLGKFFEIGKITEAKPLLICVLGAKTKKAA